MSIELNISPLFPSLPTHLPFVSAGPCSAESLEQLIHTADALNELSDEHRVDLFRAGIWKPRTLPGCFEGVGEKGLEWLVEVKHRTGMLVATEIATHAHAHLALEYGLDAVWIGARTTANTFAIEEIASVLEGSDIAVLVKNPIAPSLDLWIGALRRLNNHGITRIGAIHRGFTAEIEGCKYRNTPLWTLPLALKTRYPNLPILCDPSHIAGKRDLVAEVAQYAIDRGFYGLIVESHICPESALSDAAQQITPQALKKLLSSLYIGCDIPNGSDKVKQIRYEIDDVDDQILRLVARRSQLAQEMGKEKSRHDQRPLQPERYQELIHTRLQRGAELSLPAPLVETIFDLLHDASIQIQSDVISTSKN